MACPLCSGSHPDQCPMAASFRRRRRYAHPSTYEYSREAELEQAEARRIAREALADSGPIPFLTTDVDDALDEDISW